MRTRVLLLIAAAVVLAGIGYGLKEYFRGHEDVADMKADFTLDAPALLAEFVSDEAAANARYSGKVLQVRGAITGIEAATGDAPVNVLLETGDAMASITCEFKAGDLPKEWADGAVVAVKGVCSGYLGSGLLPGNVILQRCVPAE